MGVERLHVFGRNIKAMKVEDGTYRAMDVGEKVIHNIYSPIDYRTSFCHKEQ